CSSGSSRCRAASPPTCGSSRSSEPTSARCAS
ncbi:MAG: hypothetical protein AVDCRST_MAG85-4039, partial [uncultured Solirubrobacteraceae bacterium]